MDMHFTKARDEYQKGYWEFAKELAAEGDPSYLERLERVGFDAMVNRVQGKPLREGLVPETMYWLVDESGQVHGELRLRHYLNERLEKEGGHIGYAVRPSSRRRGLGKEMLRQALVEAHKLGLDEVLITCDDDNLASAKVIEANGGRSYEVGISEYSGKPIRRYLVPT